ncbi:MAG: NfeD family protein [Clostridium perfringens]|nr:NfeD family protein [Clostridium perfringens]
MIWAWLIVIVLGVIIDILSSAFLFVGFSLGALGAIIMNLLGLPVIVQFIVFAVISSLFFIFIFPKVRKNIKESHLGTKTMEQSYVGRSFILPENIENTALIKYEGVFWTFKSESGVIKKGETVKIIGIEGNKLLITKTK